MTEAAVLRLIVSLVFIVAIILAGAWAMRRAGWLRAAGPQTIKVLGTQSLGGRNFVSIVQVEDARLVLGVTAQQVSLLHTLPPLGHGTPVTAASDDPAEPPAFASALRKVLQAR
jgi:flagellar protein FliO/FliZ